MFSTIPRTLSLSWPAKFIAFLLQTDDTPVIWRGALRHKAVQQFLEDVSWENMDYVVMDFPPGTGDEALSVAQLVPDAEGVIIVATPPQQTFGVPGKSEKYKGVKHTILVMSGTS